MGLGLEVFNFGLALDHQAQRHGLHAADALRSADLPAHHRTALEADQPIQHPARLLRIHAVHIDLFRMFKGGKNRGFCDLVVGDAIEAVLRDVFLQRLEKMPGDRLPLAVGVGRQEYTVALLCLSPELLQYLLTACCRHVFRFKVVVNNHPQLLGRQVSHVAHRGHHRVVLAQELVDLLRLRRRLHNYQILTH